MQHAGSLDAPLSSLDHAPVLLLLLLTTQIAAAPTQPGERLSVYLITMGPGDAPWEKFGHNMIWISDPQDVTDIAYNWGLFDWEEKNFIWHFIHGRLWYWMEGFDAERVLQAYLEDDRTIWVQELNLSPEQRLLLKRICRRDANPQNSRYLYDYYRDNCSTRVRDAIDDALDGQLKRIATTMPTDTTYRSETRRLLVGDPLLYTALYFILGQPIDRKLSAWDEMFIPMRMRDRLNELRLVKAERLLNTSRRPAMRQNPPNWIGWFLLAGFVVGATQAWLGQMAGHESRRAKWAFGVVSFFWTLLSALAGLLLLYGWFLTNHTAARNNENIFQLGPAALPMLVIIPVALRGSQRAATIGLGLTLFMAASSAIGLMLKVAPMMDQVNGEIIALALPANAGLALGWWHLTRRRKGATS